MHNPHLILSRNIRARRRYLGFSQAGLGATINENRRYIGRIETGLAPLPAIYLFPIAQALRIDPRLLVEKPLPDLEG